MPKLTIIADDLTGAADTGAAFASAGFKTSIQFTPQSTTNVDILVLSTESRELDRDAAEMASRDAVRRLDLHGLQGGSGLVYKKIDSVLRGHPRQELFAVMSELGATRAIIAPALPSERRTTIGGRQLVDGVPVEDSAIASPGRTSWIAELFDPGSGRSVHLLDLCTVRRGADAIDQFLSGIGEGIVIVDAEIDADLFALAQVVGFEDSWVLCGSAGFAQQIARVLPANEVAVDNQLAPVSGAILVVAGSQHRATAGQVEFLGDEGHPIIRLSQRLLDDPDESFAPVIEELAVHLAERRSVVLTTAGLELSAHGSGFVSARLAEIVSRAATSGHIAGLVLTGGDVAAAVLKGLGAESLDLRGEVRPAMPWGTIQSDPLRSVPVATKAGSFGGVDALAACLSFFRGEIDGPLHK